MNNPFQQARERYNAAHSPIAPVAPVTENSGATLDTSEPATPWHPTTEATPEPQESIVSATIVVDGVEKEASSSLANILHPAPKSPIPSTPLSEETAAALALLISAHVSGGTLDATTAADVKTALSAGQPEIAAKLGIKL